MRFGKVCLQYASEKHFFNVAEYLIDEFYAKHDVDVTDLLIKQMAKLKGNQRRLSKVLSKSDWDLVRITSPYRWAQSIGHIYIKTKFTHRLDAPACEDVFDQVIKMSDKALNLTGKCRKQYETSFYQLFFEFPEAINSKESSWIKNESDGSI